VKSSDCKAMVCFCGEGTGLGLTAGFNVGNFSLRGPACHAIAQR
jgi:hypothetical protein